MQVAIENADHLYRHVGVLLRTRRLIALTGQNVISCKIFIGTNSPASVRDDAFFASLKLYLETHKHKTAEAHELRLAFEEITGEDLNWFFNEWYFAAGHPKLDITKTNMLNVKYLLRDSSPSNQGRSKRTTVESQKYGTFSS